MKISHWLEKNISGMARVATDMAEGERALGLDSKALSFDAKEQVTEGVDADIHVIHTHLPDSIDARKVKKVLVIHGTPEHIFYTAVEAGLGHHHGFSDPWMQTIHLLKTSDALVTFWPRHQAIWQSLCDVGRKVHLIPMGINTEFWKPVESKGRFAGKPALLSAENCYLYKWPLDLMIAIPWVAEEIPDLRLHLFQLPLDQHRWWFPLIDRNGAGYHSHVSGIAYSPEGLRNAFVGVDYYIGLVKYGDHNHICLEAKASGCKVISHPGNPYSDYWVDEADQQIMAKQLIKILRAEVEPNKTEPVPALLEMTKAMVKIYESII
jgi:hypothetical protein